MLVVRLYLDVCLSNDIIVFISKYMKSCFMFFFLFNSLLINSFFGFYIYIIFENRKF